MAEHRNREGVLHGPGSSTPGPGSDGHISGSTRSSPLLLAFNRKRHFPIDTDRVHRTDHAGGLGFSPHRVGTSTTAFRSGEPPGRAAAPSPTKRLAAAAVGKKPRAPHQPHPDWARIPWPPVSHRGVVPPPAAASRPTASPRRQIAVEAHIHSDGRRWRRRSAAQVPKTRSKETRHV